MARPKQFSELPFLDDITVTDFLLGRGSYGTVHIANYGGIKCAAKKPHGFFYSFSNGNQHKDAVVRFREECNCMSEMNHPNIVHFWGMYQATDEPGPMLILEYHPTNVATLIDRFGKPLPDELAFSLLRGVAKALKYLHGRSVPIIHRDLTANNVLVSSNLQPKVSDFGMSARFLQAGADNMTQAPGNLTYMPPESLCQNPQYNTKIDIFSFGVLAMHMLSGEWPTPHSSAVHAHPGGLEAISEITRRKHYLDKIGSEHALMGMILQCIHNDPQQREEAAVIVRQMEEITTRFPMSSELESHWVAVLKQIESDGDTQTESPIETQQEPDTVDSLNENHNQNAEQSNVELQVNHSYDESPLDNVTEMQVELPAKFAHFFDSDGRCHKSEHLSLSDVLESMPSNQLSLHNMPEQIVGLIDTTHIPDFSNTVKVQIAFMRFLEISQQPHSVLFTSTCLALTGSNTGQTPLEASVDQAVAKAIPSYVANLGREVSESTTSSLAFPTTHESPASPRNDSTVAVMLLESPPQKCDLKVSVSEALVSISSTQGQIQILNNHTVIPASLENFRPPPNAWENRLISLLCQVFSKKQLHNLLKLANTPHNNVTNMVYKLANTHDNASIDILCIVNEEGNVTICFSQQSTIHELTVAMVLSSPPVVAKSHLSSGNKAVVITANADRATSYPANTNTETRCRTANMSTNKHENGGHSTTVSLSSRYHSGFAQESDKMNFPYTDVAIVNKEREETPYHNGGKDPMRYQDDSPLASHASNPLNKRGNSLSSLMSGCVLQDRLQLINMHLNRYLRRNGLMPYSPRMLIEEIVVKSTDPQHLKSQVTQSLTQCKGIVGLPRKTLYSYNKAKIESGQHTSQSIDNQPQTIRDTVRVKKKANTPPKVKTQLKSSALNRTKEKPLHSPKAPPLKLSVCNTVKKKRHSSLKSSTQLRSSGHDQLSVTGCDQMPTDQTQRISERPVVHKRNGSKKQPQKRVYKRKKKKKTSSLPETFNFAAHGEETGEVTSTLSTLSSLKSRLWFVPYQNVKKRAWWTKPVLKRLSRLKKKQTPSSNTLASMELLCKIPTGRKTPWKKRAPEIWRQRKRPPRAIKSSYYCAAYSPTCLLNSRRQSFRVEIGKMFSSKVKKRKKLLPISLPSTSTDHMNCDLSSNKDVDERHSVQDSNPLLSSSSLFAADSYRSTYNITTLQQYHDVAGFQSMCNGDVGTYVMCTKSDGGKMSLQGYNVSSACYHYT